MAEQQLFLGEPPLGANGMPPCGRLRRWGPWAWSADQGGRPASLGCQLLGLGLSWPSLVLTPRLGLS